MALIHKVFDVKISVVYPHLTKNIEDSDLEKISANTLFKYEPQKSITTMNSTPKEMIKEESISMDEIIDDLKNKSKKVKNKIDKLQKIIDNRYKNVVIEFDITDPENELLVEAEEAIFGTQTGVITYQRYQALLKYEEELEKQLMDLSLGEAYVA